MLSGVSELHCMAMETAMQLLTTVKMKRKYELPLIMNKSDTRRVLNGTPSILAHSLGTDNKN